MAGKIGMRKGERNRTKERKAYMKEYMKEYQKNNKEKINKLNREWRDRNPEYMKKYYKNNKVKCKTASENVPSRKLRNYINAVNNRKKYGKIIEETQLWFLQKKGITVDEYIYQQNLLSK